MKTDKKTSIIYTSKGDYLKIKTPKPTKSLSRGFMKYGSIAAAVVLALSLSLFNILSVPKAAVASIIMDLNTNMEIQVDKEANILKVNESSQGFESAPSDLQLEGMDIYKAVELIIEKANSEGAFGQEKI